MANGRPLCGGHYPKLPLFFDAAPKQFEQLLNRRHDLQKNALQQFKVATSVCLVSRGRDGGGEDEAKTGTLFQFR